MVWPVSRRPIQGKFMKTFILAALLLGGSALAVHAETFTFNGTGTPTNQLTVPGPNGTTRTAGFNVSKGVTTLASGKALPTDSTCAAWPSGPGDLFQSHGMCTFSDSTGAGYIRFGCNPAKEAMEENCVGGIWGTSGAYAGRSGSMAWHGKSSTDGKTATFAGAGQWGD